MTFQKYFIRTDTVRNLRDNEMYISEKDEDIDDNIKKIRKHLKIKTIIPTKFGTEIVFFNNDDAKEASKLVKSKVNGNSIFINL